MTTAWAETTLDNATVYNRSGYWGDETASDRRPCKVKVIRNADLTKSGVLRGYATRHFSEKEAENSALQINDVAMTTSGDVGKIWEVDAPDYFASNFVRILRPDPELISPGFLPLALATESVQSALVENTGGATIQNLRKDFYSSAKFALPPLDEQRRIVGILKEAFDDIATARANAEQNLESAHVLLDSQLQSVFIERRKDSEEVPIGSLCDFLNGFAFKSPDAIQTSSTQLVRMGNLYGNRLNLERSPAFYPDSFAVEHKRYLLKEDDLIMSLTGTMGKEDYGYAVRIPECSHALLMNQRIAKFDSIREDIVDRRYLFYYLRSRAFLDLLYPTAKGTRQANLSTVTIKTLPVPLCPLERQVAVASSLEEIEEQTQRLAHLYERKLVELEDLKKSLLHQAFTGQLGAQAA